MARHVWIGINMPAPLIGLIVGGAARAVAKKAATTAAKKASEKIASNSVKVVASNSSRRTSFNQGSLMRTTDAATGAAARKGAARLGVTGKKGVQPPVKINSAKKSAPSTKANARGLKAANKPVSKNNRNVGGPVLTGILKRSEPARANRTRLGNTTKKK